MEADLVVWKARHAAEQHNDKLLNNGQLELRQIHHRHRHLLLHTHTYTNIHFTANVMSADVNPKI